MRGWDRWVSGGLALLLAANGGTMLFASLAWYDAVPGVPATGPFNGHFVKDIGAVYAMAALALGWFAWRPRQAWPALVMAALWLGLHAVIHVYDAACGRSPLADLQRDLVGVYLFAAIPVLLAVFRRPGAAG